MYSKDLKMLVELETERNAKVQAVVGAYHELTEPEKALFRQAAGISQDAAANSGERRRRPSSERASGVARDRVQPLVQDLMKTLLEDYPTLLGETDIRNLMSPDYCQKNMDLQLAGFPLLRRIEAGRKGSDNDSHDRYYVRLYAGRFYVCSQWWKDHHLHNTNSLFRFVDELIEKMPAHPGIPALKAHRKALRDNIG